ncbi:MAG: MarC family protein [Tepidiformaceae bacterium]
MTDYVRLTVIFFAAINPASVALALYAWRDWRLQPRLRAVLLGAVVAIGALALAAMFSTTLLDALDIEPETFRIAAGIIMVTAGVQAVWRPHRPYAPQSPGWQAGFFPLALPLLAGPASLAAALSYAADEGEGMAVAAFVPALVAAAALVAFPPPGARFALQAVAAVAGALLVAVAAGLIVSGVRDI